MERRKINVKIISMTLTTHAIAGATVATLMPTHPILGFTAGFASHFALDAIPHWGYSVKSIKNKGTDPLDNDMSINKDSLMDLLKICTDGILGLLISYIVLGIFYNQPPFIIFLGAIASMIPDALQFVYWKWRHEPLISLQKFHIFMHAKTGLDHKPLFGILFQVAIVAFIVLILK